ncbi:hypothetical protein CHUAL_003939 [Chamberlinius hualienensis]
MFLKFLWAILLMVMVSTFAYNGFELRFDLADVRRSRFKRHLVLDKHGSVLPGYGAPCDPGPIIPDALLEWFKLRQVDYDSK